MVAAVGDLGRHALGKGRNEALEIRFKVRNAWDRHDLAPKPFHRIGIATGNKTTPVEQVTSRIDQERCWSNLGCGSRQCVTVETIEPGMSHDQSRRTQLSCQQLLEPNVAG